MWGDSNLCSTALCPMPFPHSLPYSLPPPLSLSPSPFYYYFEEGGGSHAILACWQYYCFEAVCDVCVLSLHVCVHCTPSPPSPYMCVSLPSPNHRLPGYFSQRCHNTLPLFRTSSFWGHGSSPPRTLFQVPAMTLRFFKW